MKKSKFLLAIMLTFGLLTMSTAEAKLSDYTTLRDVDKGTFNEYRYYMVNEYFKLKEKFELSGSIDRTSVINLLLNAKTGYNYLPDSLINQNFYNNLSVAVKKGIETPNSEVYYEEIVNKLNDYLEKVNIQSLSGNIEVTPSTGNAPLTATFRGRVTDPSGTIIPTSNYIWWVDVSGVKKVIGKGLSINYTFKEEGNFSVFLDVKSSHKNKAGYTDILPFSSRGVVDVKEKIASIIIYINSTPLRESQEVKFTPDESSYGLVFDATSSTPTGGARFRRTQWDFGNGVTRTYDGDPRIERVVYSREGDYTATLNLITNEGKSVERKFTVAIHKPIATIKSNKEDGFIGEKFTFSAKSSVNEKNLSFTWNIIDIANDKIITTKDGSVVNQIFSEKGRYNIQLKVKDSAGNEDTDTKIIYINSRSPIAEFGYTIPDKSKPNRILLDGTRSYDPDFSDDGKLKYVWTVNGEIVDLEQPDSKGSMGYYTFDSIGEQSVILEVTDTDEVSSIKQQKIKISSLLSVEFFPFPRVVQRTGFIKFVATSPNARYYEWDFGDGIKKSGTSSKIEYVYNKSGTFNVRLKVKDIDGNINETSKTVYVGESNQPLAIISTGFGTNEEPIYDASACSNGAYVIDRSKAIIFKGTESLNIDGLNTGLTYSWKIGNDKYLSSRDVTYKFDELGCFPIKLTVKSDKNGSLSTQDIWVKVQNIKPTLTSLSLQVQNTETDPVIVNVSALGARDPDGVIQSYLWYYYTDTDIDPQDFRITTIPNTTFVIPKITGNYYFVVVMRDNNDERFSSQDASSDKYFITLSGDNINTPLIDFKVNKNSVLIGEEAIFTTNVKNVLGQDITAKSEFAWDFDGDGFYDKETSVGNITHKYANSGTFYSKVRVKYKGMTNVRTIEMNVANILEPTFEYISIGNKYLFFNTSAGKFDHSTWDLGDATQIIDQNYFTHTYEDGQKVHNVSLKISESTKSKGTSKEVSVNLKNMITAKNSKGIYLMSYPEVKEGKIVLKNSSDKAVLYIGENSEAKNYAVDFDINIDSDLNGTKDDDIDNKQSGSFEKAGMVDVLLNDKKVQTVRIYLLGSDNKALESKDITIEKEFVKDEEIDINSIVFDGITDAEKVKVEKLKSYVQELPQEHRLKSMHYVQKLQEEWFYINEKTKVILEFEAFIDSLGVPNGSDIINLLESFLIEGQEDQSLRNMSYNVVKNLIPKELVEYKEIIKNLDQIKSNPSKLEENKVLGKEILEMIKDTSLIKNEDKVTIKTQLQVFIYGSVDKIPQEVINEVKEDDGGSNKIIGLFSSLVNIIGLLFGVVLFIIIGFYVWFKVTNKNKNQGLQDFIIEKTSNKPEDILGGLASNDTKAEDTFLTRKPTESNKEKPQEEQKDIQNPLKISDTPDWLKGVTGAEETKIEETVKVEEDFEPKEEQKKKVPDWLKGAIGTQETKAEEVPKVEEVVKVEEEKLPEIETKIEEEKVPDWLKGSLGTQETKAEEVPKVEEVVKVEEEKLPEIETKIEEEKVPDWLKGALGTQELKAEEVPKVEEEKLPEIETKIEEEKVPDWLKGALSVDNLTKDTNSNNAEEKEEKPEKKKSEKKKLEVVENIIEVEDKDNSAKKKEPKSSKKQDDNTKTKSSNEELWNDGMDVPDWLKQDDKKATKKSDKKSNDFWTLDDAVSDDSSKKE